MITFAEVSCPKCGEWRSTLITIVIDPMGKRYSCDCCAHEFKDTSSELSTVTQATMRVRDPLSR
jgi:hypothetical protein